MGREAANLLHALGGSYGEEALLRAPATRDADPGEHAGRPLGAEAHGVPTPPQAPTSRGPPTPIQRRKPAQDRKAGRSLLVWDPLPFLEGTKDSKTLAKVLCLQGTQGPPVSLHQQPAQPSASPMLRAHGSPPGLLHRS